MPKLSSSMGFRFTETKPTPLLKDFETFIRYLEQNSFALGKASEFIPYKHLAALNEAMTNPNRENTPRTPQEYYPQLHVFYHLALAGRLFRKVYPKNLACLEATERMAAYHALSPAEKYFFLLETLWIDCSWKDLANRRQSFTLIYELINFLKGLGNCKPNVPISAKDGSGLSRGINPLMPGTFVHCFIFFGWYEVERDEAFYQRMGSKDYFPVARLTPTDLGVTLIKTLMSHRPLEEWNIPHLRSEGWLPTMKEMKAKAFPDFAGLLRHLCPDGELRSLLPREVPKASRGNFVFKVNVAPTIWRTIALSSEHTLDDLHLMIQRAFKFDNDHLYAFYMDNRWYSEERFESPLSSDGPSADDVTIGELGLKVNQSFIYHFDFGDDWRFGVQLLEIKSDATLLKNPKILESHGEAPEQYPQVEW